MRDFFANRKASVLGLVAAIVLIIVGVINNQQQDVLTKAVRICLECIGIG